MSQLVIILVLVIHWIACIYFGIAYYEGFPNNPFYPPASLKDQDFFEQYSYAFNYATRLDNNKFIYLFLLF